MSNSDQVPDYNLMHVKWAAGYVPIRKAKVLVVGCNTGGDCKNFIDVGAREVWGVDVVDGIGRDFAHPHVHYLQNSVEQMQFDSDTFDLVFSFATMEHVPDIGRGFAEMSRVTGPGGWIYSVASPLWNSPYGHHKPDLFHRHPWVHLRHSKDEIISLCRSENIVPADGMGLEHHVQYMLNPEFFNMTPAERYVNVCDNLKGFEVLRNGFDFLPDDFLPGDVEKQLAAMGISRRELLAVTHYFIAKKSGGRDPLGYLPAGVKNILRKVGRRIRGFAIGDSVRS
jgi:SAM-dependent methyltransferase